MAGVSNFAQELLSEVMFLIDGWVIYHLALFQPYFVKGYNRCRFAKLKNPADLCASLRFVQYTFCEPSVTQIQVSAEVSAFWGFLGYFKVGARLYEVSIPSTLHYIVLAVVMRI